MFKKWAGILATHSTHQHVQNETMSAGVSEAWEDFSEVSVWNSLNSEVKEEQV